MEDANYYTKQQLPNHANPSKFYSHFLYKALLVLVFFVILPLFPSQAPEFLNQTFHTRGWELLQLVFVGIAVSYGLFSQRCDETEKEQNNNNYVKFDNAHSVVSRFLQVSSVFDDEPETSSGSDEDKIQTWSSKYYRNESSVVLAQDHSVLGDQRGSSSRIGEKPLLLPVRSLKSQVSDTDFVESSKESSASSKSLSRSSSNTGSKRFSSSTGKPKIGELGGLDHENLEQKLKDNVVLPSPIPWRSRSGRMEVKEEVDSTNPSMEEHELNRVESRSLKPQSSRLSRPNSSSSSPKISPKKLSPSASLSSESQAKNAEDLVRKKSFHVSSPPPPPPPPPPPLPAIRKSSSLKPTNASEPKLMSREDSVAEVKPRRSVNGPPISKSERNRNFEDKINGNAEDRSKEFDENLEGINHSFRGYSEEEKEGFDDKVIVESDGESESDNDENEASNYVTGNTGGSGREEAAVSSNVGDGGPDVDKKADEFIAKFREQIRLQRINSIRRSSAQISTKNSSN